MPGRYQQMDVVSHRHIGVYFKAIAACCLPNVASITPVVLLLCEA